MSTSPQSSGQRSIYVHLEHEPEVTQEVSITSIPASSRRTIIGWVRDDEKDWRDILLQLNWKTL